jgi:sugar-phosphatase
MHNARYGARTVVSSIPDPPPTDVLLAARALLLDMDGTLVNSDAVVDRVWRSWAAEHGLDADEVLRVAHGRQPYASMALLLPDRPVEQNQADQRRILAREAADMDGVVAVLGAPAFLAALRDLGLAHALVTSSPDPLARARMAAAGLPLPPVMVTSEHVHASKPDPEGFLQAAALLGHAPADCIVFEDSSAGIAAGIAAGMRVVGVGPRAARVGPVVTVRTLERVYVQAGSAGDILLRLG